MTAIKLKSPDLTALTKSEGEEYFKPLVSAVKGGNLAPTGALAGLKFLAYGIEAAEAQIKYDVMKELDRSGGVVIERGVTISTMRTGTLLDYSADREIAELEAKLKERKELVRTATSFHLKTGNVYFNQLTGELINPVPVKKPSQETVKVEMEK